MVMKHDEEFRVFQGKGLGERQACTEDPLILGMSIAGFSGLGVGLVIVIILVIGVICVLTMTPYERQRWGLQKTYTMNPKKNDRDLVVNPEKLKELGMFDLDLGMQTDDSYAQI